MSELLVTERVMARTGWTGPLEKIDDYHWRIPQSYDPGMRVPGMIVADERLLKDITRDQSLQQVANVAHLPGIQQYSLAMPDIHWGYGAPIGGVAAMDVKEGVVSPGMVGYDINCLDGSSDVLCEHGYRLKLKQLESASHQHRAEVINFEDGIVQPAGIAAFLKQSPQHPVYRITTAGGDTVMASADHPFWTPDGMQPLSRLAVGGQVAMHPFVGIEYEIPSDRTLLDETDVYRQLRRLGKVAGQTATQVVSYLHRLHLLPLCQSDPRMPIVLKLLGYVLGDGTIYFVRRSGAGRTAFYGRLEDLESIRTDVQSLGFNAFIHRRERDHVMGTSARQWHFHVTECALHVPTTSFAVLLAALGAPVGAKVSQPYVLPAWLMNSPRWQQRLFLGALFGAELSAPKALYRYHAYPPQLTMHKLSSLRSNALQFLRQIARLLRGFGVVTQHALYEHRAPTSRAGREKTCFRLIISATPDNLIRLFSQVGYVYHQDKMHEALLMTQYLKCKLQVLRRRETAAATACALQLAGQTPSAIYAQLTSPWTNRRFLERSLYEGRQTASRIAQRFPPYLTYRQEATHGLAGRPYVWDRIANIEPITPPLYVYDLTVKHPGHNFIANGFVVSNCGVRLIHTNLHAEDVQPKLKTLVATLFNEIPCGVGQRGDIRVGREDAKHLLIEGSRWAVKQGYGVPEDAEATEAGGALEGADPDAVSERAYERGKNQLGTLGSGNHFLEVQAVDQLYGAAAKEIFDLEQDQVTVMIHSGSRGFGYQNCDDYLKVCGRAMAQYGMHIPDRQLACVPIASSEGQQYLGAMRASANYAWANRQCLMHLARKVFEKVFGRSWQDLGMWLIYDVAHNIAKFERHRVNGEDKLVCVHRKGATRAFPPGHPEIPARYRSVGQPVIIPGDMGRNSYLLAGTDGAMQETFGTTCHGAGRVMSRTQAVKEAAGRSIERELEGQGIIVMGRGRTGIAEEQPKAYKDINDVVSVVHNAGIAKRICRVRPLGVIKG